MILRIPHGYSVKEDGDPLVEMANKAMHNSSVITTPGRFLVDMLPIRMFQNLYNSSQSLKCFASAILARVAPWVRVPQRCETMAKNGE